MVNKALSDENVSVEEFRKMNDKRNNYESQRSEMKVPKKEGSLKRSQSIRDLTEELLKRLQQSKLLKY